MERTFCKAALAAAAALGVAMTTPAFAADSGGNTNSKTNAAVKSAEGVPVDQGATNSGTTYGSTMTDRPAAGVSTTVGPTSGPRGDSFSKTGAGMSGWASDYATAHEGRISRQAYMDEMNRRWEAADRDSKGLTPAQVSGLYGNVDSAAAFQPNGSSVQAGNMGPGNAKGQ